MLTPISGLKTLASPIYVTDNKHSFDVIEKHLETLKEVHGPIYINENTKHSFSEIQKAAEHIQNLNHPVLNTGDAKNHFNEMMATAEKLKNMSGEFGALV
jgi:cbb3-type cytochrome oxidase cytochrome c subunit